MSATRVRGRIPRTPSIVPVAEKINNFAYERGANGTYEGFQSWPYGTLILRVALPL